MQRDKLSPTAHYEPIDAAGTCSIGNALMTAADTYAAHAADCDKHNAPQLAEQFRRQATDARRYASMLADADSLLIVDESGMIATSRTHEPRPHGLCPECRHYGSDCKCHRTRAGRTV